MTLKTTITPIPSKPEINLRRFLVRVSPTIDAACSSKDKPMTITQVQKFQSVIKYAWGLLELVREENAWDADQDVLDLYNEQIKQLSEKIDEMTADIKKSQGGEIGKDSDARVLHFREKLGLSRKADEMPLRPKNDDDTLSLTGNANGNKTLDQNGQNSLEQNVPVATEERNELLGENQVRFRTNASEYQDQNEKTSFKDTSNIEHILQHHREMQDELTSDLARMAKQLKMKSLSFGDMLEKDKIVFEQASAALETSYAKLRTEGGRLSEYSSFASGTTWLVYGSVLTVLICFVFVYLLIKVT